MNQRLLWNFEFARSTSLSRKSPLLEKKSAELKWEVRFFWPDTEIIVLNLIEESLLDLGNYQQKHREDWYYLLPDTRYNIKRRQNELLYKPLVKHSGSILGFGKKINIDALENSPKQDSVTLDIKAITQQLAQSSVEIFVKKEAFIYKFATTPSIKLELARLEVLNKVYFSACIEGKSLNLVKNISEDLLRHHISCDYVSFLKKIIS